MTLTETHRRRQVGVQAATIRQLLTLWPAFSLDDIDGSWAAFEGLLLALVTVRGRDSAGLAAGYYAGFRLAEGVGGAFPAVLAPSSPPDTVVGSLRFVGPFGAKKLIAAGRTDVMATTFTKVAGDVSRHVLNQGRATLLGSVQADRKAMGWSRVTGAHPCAFCMMLASRGPVYGKGGGFSAHGGCVCFAEPAYHADQPWPGKAREFKQRWEETTAGLSGNEARIAFRRAVEGRSN